VRVPDGDGCGGGEAQAGVAGRCEAVVWCAGILRVASRVTRGNIPAYVFSEAGKVVWGPCVCTAPGV